MTKTRQELHCHACGNYVQFEVDVELDGNHVLECPKCGHEHCRVVRHGQITGIRWDRRNGPTITIYSTGTSNAPAFSIDSTANCYFLANSWLTSGT